MAAHEWFYWIFVLFSLSQWVNETSTHCESEKNTKFNRITRAQPSIFRKHVFSRRISPAWNQAFRLPISFDTDTRHVVSGICSFAESNVSVRHSCRIEQVARKRYHNSTIWIQLVNHTFCNTDLVVENICCKGGFPLGGIFRTKGKFLLPSDHRMELIDILLNLNRGKPA